MAGSPFDMMAKQILKSFGLSPEKIEGHIEELRGVVHNMAGHAIATFNGVAQANRRLARIEAHLGLGEIEPVPQSTLVIEHEKPAVVVNPVEGA